jgi:hypothetical protein
VLYAREPFRDAVKRITDGRGADVVFDPVGGEVFENSCAASPGARAPVIGFTGGIGLARTNLVLIKGASVLGVRAGEAVRKNPGARRSASEGLDGMGGGGQNPPQRLAPAAAGKLRAGDAASDRPQGHRPRGADDEVVQPSCPEGGASSTPQPLESITSASVYWITRLRG